MTPSQIDRAVRRALMDVLPPLVGQLRDALVRELAVTPAAAPGPTVLKGAWADHWTAVMTAGQATDREERAKHGRRLSAEQVAEIWRLRDKGWSTTRIAAQVGATHSSVHYRLQQPRPAVPSAAPETPAPPADDAAFRDAWANVGLTVAEVARQFGLNEDAARARAKRLGLGAKVAARRHEPKAPLEAVPAAGLEPVPASPDDAADWLTGALQRERLSPAEIEQRLAILRPAGVLAECNARRVKLGLPPYVIARRAA